MKLNELYTKPLSEALAAMELTSMKVNTDDVGTVRSIELKYDEKIENKKGEIPEFRF